MFCVWRLLCCIPWISGATTMQVRVGIGQSSLCPQKIVDKGQSVPFCLLLLPDIAVGFGKIIEGNADCLVSLV